MNNSFKKVLLAISLLLFFGLNTPAQKDSLVDRSISRITLTEAEKEWLSHNHTVRIRIADFAPHIFINGDNYKGISIDFIKLIAERTEINFVFTERIKGNKGFWEDVRNMGSIDGPDLIIGMENNPEIAGNVSFSQSYMRAPHVIITQTESRFVAGTEDLSGSTVAMTRGAYSEQIAKDYDDIEVLWLPSVQKAMEVVSKGLADAYIGDLLVASYVIQAFGYSNLKVAAPGPLGDRILCFGSREDWPELTSIINKALDEITSDERAAIQGRYLSLRYEHGIDSKDVVKWILLVLFLGAIVIAFFIFWNKKLKRLVNERTATITSSEKRFRATFEQAAVGIAHVSTAGKFIRINQKFCDIVGYSHEEMNSLTFQDITYPEDLDADIEQFDLLLKGEKETYSMEKRYFHKDGHIVWVNLTVSMVKDQSGNPLYFVSVVENINTRKEAEVALRTSENSLKDAQSIAHLGNWTWDIKKNIITWSDEVFQIYGLEKDTEITYETVLQSIHPDDRDYHNNHINQWLENKQSDSYIYRMIRPDNQIRYIHSNGKVTYDEIGDPIILEGTAQDITERKQAEEALQETEELLKITEEKAHIGQYSGDFITKKGTWSDEQYRIFGYSPGEIEPSMEVTLNHVHPEDREKWLKANQEHVQKNIPYHLEYRIIRKDGTVRTLLAWSTLKRNDDGSPICTVGLTQDITDRKQAEEERSLLFDLSSDLMSITSFDGISTQMNPAWATTMGYTSEELLAVPFFNLLHPDDKQKTIDEIEKISKGGYKSNNFENRYIHKNGSILHVSWKVTALVEQNLMFSIGRDITEQKKVEKQVAKYQNRLKALASELTKTEEIQRKQIATDLHDQVGQLLAASRLQLATFSDKMEKAVILAKMKNISLGLQGAIQATRSAIFELSPPQLNEIGLFAALSDWMDEEIQTKYGIQAELTGDYKIFPIKKDFKYLLFRSTRELLINMVKHAHANKVEVNIIEEQGKLCINVADNGVGFDYNPEMLHLKETGFGLFSISERIEDVGGTMEIITAPGNGCTVKITVPLNN